MRNFLLAFSLILGLAAPAVTVSAVAVPAQAAVMTAPSVAPATTTLDSGGTDMYHHG